MTTVSVTGGSSNITVYGSASVYAGSGNDTIDVYGRGLINVGNGNDSITVHEAGKITVGNGNDTINLMGNGVVTERGFGGHDTITLGTGADTIFEHGQATVYGAGGSATITGGQLDVINTHCGIHELAAMSGNATLIGGDQTNRFIAGTGSVVMQGGSSLGTDTFIGGSGHDTMTGGGHHNLFEFLTNEKGGQTVITNFVSGQDQLYVEGRSLSYLTQHHDISTSGGNTFITIDGGATTIELKGITSLGSSDVTTHK